MRPSEPAPKSHLPPRVRAVTDGVYQVTTFTLRPPEYVNAFLVDGDEGVTLIDTSMPAGERVIVAALAAIGRSVDDITAILLTHCHLDHVGSAAALKRSSGARVFASPTDAPAIEGNAPVPPPPAAERLAMFASLFRFLPLAAPVHVDRFTAESAANDLPADLSVLDTPGHTPGHVSYLLDRAGGVLFVGDAAMALPGGRVIRGPMNRAEPVLDASVRHLAEATFDVACFGHSPPLTSRADIAFRRLVASWQRPRKPRTTHRQVRPG
jgi:glyoxylase-like metal-dependent hydrolase (beta-lactamase superfamily II)